MQFEGISADQVEARLGEALIMHLLDGGERVIPIDEQGAMLLNYRGRGAFKPYSEYIKLMQQLNEHGEAAELPDSMPKIDGQILIIGQMAEGLTDFGATPFSSLEPLVLVQAVALNTILRSDYLHVVPIWQILLGWLPIAWGRFSFSANHPYLGALPYRSSWCWPTLASPSCSSGRRAGNCRCSSRCWGSS